MAAEAAVLTRLTYEDLLGFPEDGLRHELIDGDHFVSPSPKIKHQAIVANLLWQIRAHLAHEPQGRVFAAPTDVVLSDIDVVVPDLLFVSAARLAILTADNLTAAPDLVVEVLSDSTRRRDEITKRHLYERFGVEEYWVIDPEIDSVKVYRRSEGRFRRTAEVSLEEGGELTSPLLPGLTIPIARVFE